MTEKISTPDSRGPQKSFFKRYLKYSFGENKVYFLLSLICSVMSALVYVAVFTLYKSKPHFLSMGMNTQQVVGTVTFFAFASIWGQYVLCITGGIRCFQHLTRKNKTDTLMCLPLTHSERFWGNLLTGYLTTAAPLLPCGILGVIAAVIVRKTGTLPENLVEFALVFNTTLFFVMTFAYLLSVLAASLCGNRAGGIAAAVLLAVISVGIPAAWGEYFIANIIGYPMFNEFTFHPHALIPSFALISEFDSFVGILSFGSAKSLQNFQVSDYSAANPLNIVFYVLLSLGVIAISYLISKNRKCEHTGEIFAAKHAATVITILAAFTMTGALSYWFEQTIILATILSSIVVSAVIFLAAELILRRGVKKLGHRVIVYAVSTAVSVGFSVLISVTYALGVSFILPSADKIKSVEFMQGGYQTDITKYDAYYSFDQKPDIEKLRENHALLLKEHIGLLDSNRYQSNGNSDLTTFKYTLKNGETFQRIYLINHNSIIDEYIPGEHTARAALKAIPKPLDSYPAQYAAPLLSDTLIESKVSLGGKFGTYYIRPEKLPEFARILHDDTVSHYSPDSMPVGGAKVSTKEKKRTFDIFETYENTLAFIKDESNAEFSDETPFTFNFYGNNADFMIDLTKEDMDSPAGKELKALMRSCHPSDVETISSEEYRNATRVSSPDYFNWYVPQSNMPQVIKLITEIASERI